MSNNNLVEQFKAYLSSQKNKPSKATVKNYKADVSQFIRWWEEKYGQTFNPPAVTFQMIEAYKKSKVSSIEYLVSSKDASPLNTKYQIPNTISQKSLDRHLSSLRKFFHFLKLEGIISSSPFELDAKRYTLDADPYRLKEFKDYLYIYNASPLTIKNYIIDVKQFMRWLEEVSRVKEEWDVKEKNLFDKIDGSIVEEYKHRLLNQAKFSPTSINRKLSSLRKYIAWASSEGLVSQSNVPSCHPELLSCHPELVSGSQKGSRFRNEFGMTIVTQPPQLITNAELTNSLLSQDEDQHLRGDVAPAAHLRGGNEAKNSFSKIPPIRLLQKVTRASLMLCDLVLTLPIKKILGELEYRAWKLRGKPLFTPKINTDHQRISAENPRESINVSNISKAFYAPLSVAIKHLPLHHKLWHHINHTRPNWYKRYQAYPAFRYFQLVILLIFAGTVSLGLYKIFIEKAQQNPGLAYTSAAKPFSSGNSQLLSFQGRLTDNLDNPITAATPLRFSIYNNSTATSAAYAQTFLWQEVVTVSPDTDGIFSALLGQSVTLDQALYATQSALWLGVSVGQTAELSPRQQVATVAYAVNANTLQGLPPTTDTSVVTTNTNAVLALNSSGQIVIPTALTTTLTTFQTGGPLAFNTGGGNERMRIDQNGNVGIGSTSPIARLDVASTLGTSPAASVSGRTSYAALTVDNLGTAGDIFAASSSGLNRFVIQNNGNVGIGTTLPTAKLDVAGGNIALNGGYLSGDGGNEGIYVAADGSVGVGINNPTASFVELGSGKHFRVLGGLASFIRNSTGTAMQVNQAGTGYIATFQDNGTDVLTIIDGGNVGIGTTAPIGLLNVSGAATGIAAAVINNTQTDGTLQDIFTASAAGTTRFTIQNNGNVGINPPTLGPVATLDVRGNLGTSPVASISGNTAMPALLVDNKWTSNIVGANADIFAASASGQNRFVIRNNGNVGVGTTLPSEQLQVKGSGTANTFIAVDNTSTGFDTGFKLMNGGTLYWQLLNDDSDSNALNLRDGGGNIFLEVNDQGTAADFAFNTDDLFIKNDGNVGIGTTGPGTPLHLYKSDAGTNDIVDVYKIQRVSTGTPTAGFGEAIAFYMEDLGGSNDREAARIEAVWQSGANYESSLRFHTRTASGTTERMRIDNIGNVGIGTTSSLGTLDVRGNLGTNPVASISGSTAMPALLVDNKWTSNIVGANADIFAASASGLNRFVIQNNGNVGIGTAMPDYLLELNETNTTPAFALSDDDIAHGVTTVAQTDSFFHLSSISTTDGGAYLQGITDNVAGATALQLRGIQNSDPTDTTPAIKLIGTKANGTGVQDLAAAETVLQIANNDDTAALTVLGNGNVGIGTTVPGQVLHAVSTGGIAGRFDNSSTSTTLGGAATLQLMNTNSSTVNSYSNLLFYHNNSISSQIGFADIAGVATNITSGAETGALAFSTRTSTSAFSEKMRIDNLGNIGIGTSSPLGTLDVRGNLGTSPVASISGNTAMPALLVDNRWNGVAGANADIFAASSSGLNRFVIRNNGNVGIGTTITSGPLHVRKDIANNIPYSFFENSAAAGGVGIQVDRGSAGGSTRVTGIFDAAASGDIVRIGANTNHALSFLVNASDKMRIDTSGNVGIGTTSPLSTLDLRGNFGTSPVASISGNTAMPALLVDNRWNGVAGANADIFAASASGQNRFVITNKGYVGIGTSLPVSILTLGSSDPEITVDTADGSDTKHILLSGGGGNSSARGAIVQADGNERAANPGDLWLIAGNVSGGDIRFGTGGVNDIMDITYGGNIGIGTTAPAAKLDLINTLGNSPAASISGRTAFATFTVDNLHTNASDVYGDIFAASASGQNRFVIRNNGNVGIGTTLPSDPLEISRGGNSLGTITALRLTQPGNGAGDGSAIDFYFSGPNKIGRIYGRAVDTNKGDLRFAPANGTDFTDAMTILNNGNVGIGVTNPESILDIHKDAGGVPLRINLHNSGTATGDDSTISFETQAQTDFAMGIDRTDGKFHFDNAATLDGTSVMTIDSAGNIGIGTTSPLGTLDVRGILAAPAASISGRTAFATFTVDNLHTNASDVYGDIFAASSSGLNRFVIQNNGNVGIGTTLPAYKLEVSGSYNTAQLSMTSSGADAAIAVKNTGTGGREYWIDSGSDGAGIGSGNFALYDKTANTTRFVVNSSGNFGIGTTTPLAKFETQSLIAAPAASISGRTAFAAFTVDNLHTNSGDVYGDIFAASASGQNRFVIRNNGNVGIGITLPSTLVDVRLLGTGTGDIMSFGNVTNGRFGKIGMRTSDSAFTIGGATNDPVSIGANAALDHLYIDTTGYVGIGITNPAALLDVRKATDGEAEVLRLANSQAAAGGSTNETVALRFMFDLDTDNLRSGGKIVAGKVGDYTDGSTQDSFLAFYTSINGADTERVRIMDVGNVGIGTTSPLGTLDVRGNLGTSPVASISGSTAMPGLIVDNKWTSNILGANADIFAASASGLNRFVIQNNGNVGIGTTGPGALLHTVGGKAQFDNNGTGIQSALSIRNTNAAAADLGVRMNFVGSGDTGIVQLEGAWDGAATTDGYFAIKTRKSNLLTEQVRIASTGNVGIGTTSPLGTLDVRGNLGTSPVASISGNTAMPALLVDNRNNGVLGVNADIFAASASGQNRFVIRNNGNVGIGTSMPASTFQIGSGQLRVPDGTSGTPSIAFSTSTNGFYGVSSDQIGTSGNFRIGTSLGINANANGTAGNIISTSATGIAFDAKITTAASDVIGARLRSDQTDSSIGLVLDNSSSNNVAVGIRLSGSALTFNTGLVSGGTLSNATERVRIDNLGNVGIGSTTPNAILNVNASPSKGTALAIFNNAQTAGTLQDIFTASAAGVTKFTIQNNGNVGINPPTLGPVATLDVRGNLGTSPVASISGNTTMPALLVDNKNTGVAGANADIFAASASGQNRFVITNAGNVGIGTTLPSSLLQLSSSFTTQTVSSLVADSLTTGTGFDISVDALSTGKGINLASTSIAFSSGTLMNLDWSPSGSTEIYATGDILSINAGQYANAGNLLNLKDNGSSVFSVSQSQVTTSLPAAFNAAGDVSIAYDINFTNPVASYIKSFAPIYIEAGPIYASSNLTLRTFNVGNVIVDSQAFVTNYSATVSSQLVVGTSTAPANIGGLYLTNSSTFGKALAILNQTETTDLFTASLSGTTKFVINSSGYVGIGNSLPVATLDVRSLLGTQPVASVSGNTSMASLVVDNTSTTGDIFAASASGQNRFVIRNNGNVGIGTTLPGNDLDIQRNINGTVGLRVVNTDGSNGNAAIYLGTSVSGAGVDAGAHLTWTLSTNTFNIDTGQNPSSLFSVNTRADAGASTERFRIDSKGNVGIGTTSPVALLEVYGQSAGNAALMVDQRGASTSDIFAASASGTTRFIIGNNGNVGINPPTLGPVATLDVRGNLGTSPVASISGNTTMPALLVDNKNTGVAGANADIFAASASGQNRFVIRNNGNVGIGTAMPSSLLYVSAGTAGDAELVLEADTDNNDEADNPFITFKQDQNLVNAFIGLEGYAGTRSTSTLDNAFVIGSENSNPAIQFITNDTVRMTIAAADGNVGIGTTAPGAELEVYGSTIEQRIVDSAATGNPKLSFYQTTTERAYFQYQDSDDSFDINTDSHIDFMPNNTQAMRIDSVGRVGIGTTSPLGVLQLTGIAGGNAAAIINQAGSIGDIFTASSSSSTKFVIQNNGNVGINPPTLGPVATLDVRGNLGTSPVASISGSTAMPALIVDNKWTSNILGVNADIFAASASGQNRFVIRNNGNVGIGTTLPGNLLSVAGNVEAKSVSPQFIWTDTSTNEDAFFAIANSDYLEFGSGNTRNILVLAGETHANAGNVGIGTTAPGATLDIQTSGITNIRAYGPTNPYLYAQDSTNNVITKVQSLDTFGYVGTESNHDLRFITNNSAGMALTTGGNLGIGTTSPLSTLDVRGNLGTSPVASISGNTAMPALLVDNRWNGVAGANGDIFAASASGQNRFVIQNNGNVGIGTTIPSGNLHVRATAGNTTFYLDGRQTNQFVMTANTSNNFTMGTDTVTDVFTLNGTNEVANTLVLNAGNVGIGTTAAGAKVEIQADANTGGAPQNSQLWITGSSSNTKRLYIGMDTSTNKGILQAISSTTGPTYAPINISPYGGNVGIGIGSNLPMATLDLQSLITAPAASISGRTAFATFTVDNLHTNASDVYGDIFAASASGQNRFVITNAGRVGIGYTAGMTGALNVNGSVGIGTTEPVAGSGLTIAPAARTTGTPSLLRVTGPADTGLTVVEANDAYFNLGRTVFFTSGGGTITNQRAFYITAPTYKASTNPITITNLATMYISGAPVASTNVGNTTSAGLRISNDTALSTNTTNGYGLYVDAPTGATNNYAATFASGNVGIGTTSPNSLLTVSASPVKGTALVILNNAQTAGTLQDIFTASAAGVTKFTIQNNGNVGINPPTLGPVATLDIRGNLGTSPVASISGSTAMPGLLVDNKNGTWGGAIFAASSSGMSRFMVGNNGNVGIGTSMPTGQLYVYSAQTALQTSGLGYFDWTPGSAVTSTNDLFTLNVGSNGTLSNIFNIKNAGSSVFSVSQTAVTTSLPAAFNAAGDVSIAYDINMTNPTAAYIKSNAPLYIQAGKIFNSSDLTLRTFNVGNVIVDSQAFVTNYSATVSSQLVVGTSTPTSSTFGGLYLTNSSVFNKALAMFNQTESQDIFTASSSSTTRFTIQNNGNVGINPPTLGPVATLDVRGNLGTSPVASISGSTAMPALIVDNKWTSNILGVNADIFAASASGQNRFVIRNNGNVGIGTTLPPTLLSITQATNAFSEALRLTNTVNSGEDGSYISYYYNTANVEIGRIGGIHDITGANNGALTFWTINNNSIAERLRIDHSGNVGIGTTTSLATLDVRGNLGTSPVASISGNTAMPALLVDNRWNGVAGANADIFAASASGANRFVITNAGRVGIGYTAGMTGALAVNGNVGIGTNAPSYPLHTVGSGYFTTVLGVGTDPNTDYGISVLDAGSGLQNILRLVNTQTEAADTGLNISFEGGSGWSGMAAIKAAWEGSNNDNAYLGFSTRASDSNTEKVRITSAGNVGIGTTSPNSLLTVSASPVKGTALVILNNAQTAGTLQDIFTASAAGTTRFTIQNNGNVGINPPTLGPVATLDVRGNLGTSPVASISGNTAMPALLVDNKNTGVLGANADIFAASASGQNRFVIRNNGNVGIGTTLPSARLDINAGTVNGLEISGFGTGDFYGIDFSNSGLSGTSDYFVYVDSNDYWRADGAAQFGSTLTVKTNIEADKVGAYDSTGLRLTDDADNLGIFIEDGGYVGIGTSDPAINLDVNGGAYIGSSTEKIYLSDQGDYVGLVGWDGSGYNDIGIRAQAGTQLYLKTDGTIGIGTTSPLSTLDVRGNLGTSPVASISGSTAMPGLIVDNKWTSNILGANADIFAASASGQNRFVIRNNGNIGVGTTLPGALFDVNGQARVKGTLLSDSTRGDESYRYNKIPLWHWTNDPSTLKDVTTGTTVEGFNYGTWDGKYFWIGNYYDQALIKVDQDGRVVKKYTLPANLSPLEIAWDGTYVWIGSADTYGRLYKFDPVTETASYVLMANAAGTGSGGIQGVVYDGSDIWLGVAQYGGGAGSGLVQRVNTSTGAIEATASAITNVNGLAITNEVESTGMVKYIWAAASGSTHKIRASDTTEVASFTTDGAAYRLATDGTYIYVASWSQDKIYKAFAKDATKVATFSTASGDTLNSIAFDGRYLWVAGDSNNINIHDPDTGYIVYTLNPGSAGNHQNGLVFDGTYMWGINWSTSHVYKFSTGDQMGNTKIVDSLSILDGSTSNTAAIFNANGILPVASMSANTSFAAMVVDNKGSGPLFTASSSGLNRFVITQNGNVGIGTTLPNTQLELKHDSATEMRLSVAGFGVGESATLSFASDATKIGQIQMISNSGTNVDMAFSGWKGNTLTEFLRFDAETGAVGIGTTGPLGTLDVRGNLGTSPVASISGSTAMPGLIVDNKWTSNILGANADIFAASASGLNRFVIQNNGNVGIGTSMPTGQLHVYSAASVLQTSGLGYFDWTPGSAVTSTNDLFTLNVGSNGTLNNIFNIKNAGSSVFSVSQTAVTTSLPTAFNAAGDVSFSYDINMTNPTASYLKTAAPLYIQAGETFNSSDLTLRTFQKGNVIIDSEAFVTNYSATVSSRLVVGTSTPLSGSLATLPALYAAGINGTSPVASISGNTAMPGLLVDNRWNGVAGANADIIVASASGAPRFVIANNGNLTVYGSPTTCYIGNGSSATNCSSDLRLKDNVLSLGSSLDKILQLRPVNFTWKKGSSLGTRTGFIAQEVQQIFPEFVDTLPDGYYGLDYAGLVVPAIKAIQEQQVILKDINFTSTGDLSITENQELGIMNQADFDSQAAKLRAQTYSLSRTTEVIGRIGGFAEIAAAKLKAGFIESENVVVNNMLAARKITTDSLTIGGVGLRDYISQVISETLALQGLTLQNQTIISPIAQVDQIHTNLITPLASDTIRIEGKITAAEISVNQLEISENLSAREASISGTLWARKIIADEIEGLEATISSIAATRIQNIQNTQITSASEIQNSGLSDNLISPIASDSPSFLSFPNIISDYADIASYSGQLAYVDSLNAATATFTQGLMSFGPASFADISVADQLSIGGNLVLAETSINVLGSTLEIQPLRQGNVSFMGGLMVIDTDGNLKVGGNAEFAKDVSVKGTLAAGVISPLPNKDVVVILNSFQDLNENEIPNQVRNDRKSHLIVQNASGSAVLSINQLGDLVASGAASFAKLNLSAVSPALALSSTEIIATGSAGTTTIAPNKPEITINNSMVTENSLIYITPVGTPSAQIPFLSRQIPGKSFTVGISGRTTLETPFNWLIVN